MLRAILYSTRSSLPSYVREKMCGEAKKWKIYLLINSPSVLYAINIPLYDIFILSSPHFSFYQYVSMKNVNESALCHSKLRVSEGDRDVEENLMKLQKKAFHGNENSHQVVTLCI